MKTKKNVVKLTESELKRVIYESIRTILKQNLNENTKKPLFESLDGLSYMDLFNKRNQILNTNGIDAYVLKGESSDNNIIVSVSKDTDVDDVSACLSQYGIILKGQTGGVYPYDRNCFLYIKRRG